jgi:small subunit ribosomal protein S4
MARYTGPKARVSRRLGANIWGTAGENRAMERRPYPPGEHGRSRRRNASEYLLQMQEKQKARFTYGLNERQFRNLYEECSRRKGVTGELMLQLLERRLDNVVYRAGWASTRPQAISLRGKARQMIVIQWNRDVLARTPPPWLDSTDEGLSVKVREYPLREHIDVPVREQLIVELYSK